MINLRTTGLACFAAGLALAALTGCSHAPRSSADCGWHYRGGAGLLGLAGAMGAFDRDAGPDCQPSGYAATPGGYIPPNETWTPPDPAPMPDNRPRFLVPGGGGTLMEIGGVPQLLAPAGDGAFVGMP
jgi:hypothetical protein